MCKTKQRTSNGRIHWFAHIAVILAVFLQAPAASQAAVAPHRVVYSMALDTVRGRSSITGATGKLIFEWNDACDAYIVQQGMHIDLSFADGEDTTIDSTVLSWESKDGSSYRFNARRLIDEAPPENLKGQAHKNERGGEAHYATPTEKTESLNERPRRKKQEQQEQPEKQKPHDISLAPNDLFPAEYTLRLIEEAKAGRNLFSVRVFDGADEEGLTEISAFIGRKKSEEDQAMALEKSIEKSPLLEKDAWPVRMAFYKTAPKTLAPDYEMDMLMQSNGVARSIRLDYGDFSLAGKMIELKPLATICK